MDALSQILGTMVGFATVMLTASLVVMALVRTIHYLADKRGKTLGEMLATLNQGYRLSNGDAATPGDAAEAAFVTDVLTYPTLHLPSELARVGKLPKGATPQMLEAQRARLAHRVEYLSMEDLIEIVRTLSGGQPGDELPARWHDQLPPKARRFAEFAAYVKQWFRTVEGVSSEQFKNETRTLTAVVSCIVVVLLNMDGFQLASSLYRDTALQEELAERAPDILALAEKRVAESATLEHEGRDKLLEGVAGDLTQTNGLLNEPGLQLGWQNSWMARSWCEECREGVLPPRTPAKWTFDVLRWLAGLLFSCVMLSLGAPFWMERLRELINLQNSVQAPRTKKPAPKPG